MAFILQGINGHTQTNSLSAPSGFTADPYHRHNELSWNRNPEPSIKGYRIYRAGVDGIFQPLKLVNENTLSYIDFIGGSDSTFHYYVKPIGSVGEEGLSSDTLSATTFEMTEAELLTMVQEYTFRYFWDFAHPVSGLARERNSTSIVTSGGSGFGVMAIIVGIERGFITRQEGLQRLLKISKFLYEKADRFKGVFPHWMNGATGSVIPFSQRDNGGDLVETSFMIQGLLAVRTYFDGDSEQEQELRDLITSIWEEVDWNWYRKQNQNVLYWHWSPEYNFEINFAIRGYFEALITYLLAIASPTHPVPANLYHKGWAGSPNYVNGNEYYGIELPVGPSRGGPLFFSHYSFLGFDPRGIKDDYANYYINGINHTLINQAHCVQNPGNYIGYSEECWGLTASDDPFGYLAHSPNRDNGTITPTAALSSMPYTPGASKQAMKHFYEVHGDRLWGTYGFYDAFNLTENWFADSYLAIDQGPIIVMIENYRTGLLWDLFMANPEIQPALDAIGFVTDTTEVITNTEEFFSSPTLQTNLYPSPASEQFTLEIKHPGKHAINVQSFNINGQLVYENQAIIEDTYKLNIPTNDWPKGTYYISIQTKQTTITEKIIIQH